MGKTKRQQSLTAWTKQKWRTKSGNPSKKGPKATNERYMPASAIKSLTAAEHAATTRAKRKATKQGKQFAANTPSAKKKITRARKAYT